MKWYFGRGGFTEEAERLLRKNRVLFSDEEALSLFTLRPLPPLKE